jgi:hypothetical protein
MTKSPSADPSAKKGNLSVKNTLRAAAAVATLALAGCSIGPKHDAAPAPKAVTTTSKPKTPKVPLTPTPVTETKPNYGAIFTVERQEIDAGLPAVSQANLQSLISLIESRGYIDPQLPDTKRYVVEGTNGIVYTAELDFAGPAVTTAELEAVTIYLRKPGEVHAQQVITDGSNPLDAPTDHFPINSIVDTPIGYTPITTAEISADINTYGDYAGDAEDISALRAAGPQIQQDYIEAVNQILEH